AEGWRRQGRGDPQEGASGVNSAARVTAWDNLTWVLCVMHLPREPALLDHVAAGNDTLILNREDWRSRGAEAALRASTVGDVLAMVYAMDQAPWQLTTEPSIGKA